MALNPFSRTELLLGKEAVKRLAGYRVAVFGIGGVGGYAVEAMVRSGIGALDLVDHDTVSITNLNRQIIATQDTIGKRKVEVAAERIHSINPDCRVRTFPIFYLPDTADQFDFHDYDYVVDAIDTVTGKLQIIEEAMRCGVPVISAMGAGNKLDASRFEVADISETSVCPLARTMRRELRRRGIEHLKVVYSREKPIRPQDGSDLETKGAGASRRPVPGSIAFVPAAAGLILGGEVVKDLAAGAALASE